MTTGITRQLTGNLTFTDRYEMTADDDILNISNATINLKGPAGDLFTNEGNDTVTVINSTINALAEGLSFFLGSGNDTLILNNSTLNASTLTGSSNDTVKITGGAQSRVILKKRSDDPTLSLGGSDDVLELAAILEGDGDIDFGTGNDTLRFDGGSLLTTGMLNYLNNLTVTTAGGTLGRNLDLTGGNTVISLSGNLTGNTNSRGITIAPGTVTLTTANNVRTNVSFSIGTDSVFTHQAGGTLEISGNSGYIFSALKSVATLHDLVVSGNGGGLIGSNTAWTIRDSDFANNTNSAANLIGGSLDLTNVGISNQASNSLLLEGTILTGNDVSFSANRAHVAQASAAGGAIHTNSNVTLEKAKFTNNSAAAIGSAFAFASSSTFASALVSASASASGGAIYQNGGNLTFTSATFNGNYASALASSYASASNGYIARATSSASAFASGGAIYQNGGSLTSFHATFSGNYASASACATARGTGYPASGYASATAFASGGAIYQNGGNLTFTSATFNDNYAFADASAYAYINAINNADSTACGSALASACGGAIYQNGGSLTLTSATFNGNCAIASAFTYSTAYGYATSDDSSYAYGGAIYASSAIVNIQDSVFINNTASAISSPLWEERGGAIYLAGSSVMTYTVTTGNKLSNTGNTAVSGGGFLFLDSMASCVFDIDSGASLTIGSSVSAASDQISGSGSVVKSGAGILTLHAVAGYTGKWTVSGGVLHLATIARTIKLDDWTIGVDGILQLSEKNDTVNMSTDKKIGVLDLGGGSDILNTGGYALSGGELRISTLTLTGGGRISSAITTRVAGAGFDLTLENVELESSITGGNAIDTIRITQEARLGGVIDLGNGNNVITATAKVTFGKTLTAGIGNDTFTFTCVTFDDTVNLGDGTNRLTATENVMFAGGLNGGRGNDILNFTNVTFKSTVNLGDGANEIKATALATFDKGLTVGAGNDTLSLADVMFGETVNLGNGTNTLTATGTAVFGGALVGGIGNDTITLQGDSQLNGLVSLGGGKNMVATSANLSVRDGFLLDSTGETRLVINRGAALAGNVLNVYSHEGAQLKSLTLDWSSIPDLDKVRIVVSSDASFDSFEFTVELYNQSKSFTLNVEESYYIQFQAQDEDGWKQRYLPDTVAPDQVTDLSLEQGIGSWSVTHDNWGGNGVKQYRVEVSSNVDFTSVLNSATVTTTEYAFTGLSEGNYYWRVRAEDYTGNLGEWSKTATIFIDYTAPTAPRGLISAQGDYSVSLGWTAAIDTGSGVAHYEYRIATDSGFASITVSGESTATSNVMVNNLAYGNYYWQVRAIDNSGNVGEWSLYKNFFIADTIAPTAPEQLDYQLDGNTVTLDWLASLDDASGSGLKEYRIEFSDQADFSKIILSYTSSSTRISIDDLAGGNYFCRVSAVDQSGNVSEWSNIQNFQIEGTSPSVGPTKSDFDGNGVSDILFQNLMDSANPLGAWMNADKWQWNGALGAAPKSDWTVYGAYDFTGDGVCDIMFRSKRADTQYAVGYYEDGDVSKFRTMGWGVTAEWELADVGDFNGSGRADILWKNSTNGYLGLWMDGTDQWVALPASNLGEGQSIIGMGDVNGDGCDDILINSNGVLGAWDISGVINGTETTPVWSSFGINIGSEWDAFGCADFDGNGKADIVLWRDDDGYVGTYMNCNVNDFRGIYPGASKDEWGLPGFGDYNGDGCDDVLVRNLASGALGYWDGAADFKWNEIGSGVDSTWAVIA